MVNKLVDACTRALDAEFGDDYTYYVDSPEQNFKTPSFTADVVNPMMERKHPFSYSVTTEDVTEFKKAMLYYRVMPVVLHYFPLDKFGKKECFAVAERLYDCMEEIEIDGRIVRGVDLEMQITENVLQFFVTYKFFTMKTEDDEDGFESVFVGVNAENE